MCHASGRPELAENEGKQRLFKKLLRRNFGMKEEALTAMDFESAKFPAHQVRGKAVDMMGDEELKGVNRELLPAKANVSSKALHLVGDSKVIQSEKLRNQVGSVMSPDQVKKQRASEEAEDKERQKKGQAELDKLLRVKSIESDPGLSPKVRVADKVVGMLGDGELAEMNKELLPENAKVSSKALHMVGDSKVIQSEKARNQVGSVMSPEQVKKQRDAESEEADQNAKEAKEQLKQILKTKGIEADPEATPKTQVTGKAIEMMGDQSLEDINKELLPANAKVNSKALHVVGESKVIQSEKVRKQMGEARSQEEVIAQRVAEKEEMKRQESLAQAKVKEILNTTLDPSESVKPDKQVQDKALDIMGDDTLEEMNKELLPAQAKVNAKALHMVGDSKVIQGQKARRMQGSMMHADQIQAQKLAEEIEQRRKEIEQEEQRKQLIAQKSCGDDKAVGSAVVSEKALKMMGDNKVIQSDKVRKRMGSMMHADQIEAQKLAEDLERMQAKKVGHRNSYEDV